jgi:Zn-dependent protease with chaperone function
MRHRLAWSLLGSLQLIVCYPRCAALAAPSGDDQQMVAVVAERIFAAADPVAGWAWPPLVAISDRTDINAFATIYHVKPGETPDVKDEGNLTWIALRGVTANEAASGEAASAAGGAANNDRQLAVNDDGTITQPIIVLYQGYLDKVVRGAPDRLAAVFGHETAHILLKHVENVSPGSPLVANIITRQQETDADVQGMKLALAADFAYKGLVAGILGMREQGNYNSFEGLNYDHPGWTDRVALIDDRQAELWKSVSAFENGVYFLMTEQYELAVNCFDQVTKDFPKCHEAWANLGYAHLMRYCDALDADNLRNFDIGHLVVGGFYRRPDSLGVRGIVEKHWFDAVGALRQALILKPELVLPKANLAVAYLVHPQGKDVGRAAELFDQVVAALKAGDVEEGVDPLVRAALLVNAGVAEAANGDAASAQTLFDEARELFAGDDAPDGQEVVMGAIRYNRGRMFAASNKPEDRKSALEELEAYLANSSPAATWWTLAYDQYKKLCADQNVEAKPANELSKETNLQNRLVTGITLPSGETVTLNDELSSLNQTLGAGRRQVVVRNLNVHRRSYGDLGLELLCTNRIVAIRMRGAKAPPLVIRAAGQGGQSREVRIGMTTAELDGILGGDADDWDQRYGTSAQIVYRFYPRLGFGVRLSGDRVSEIIVAQIPSEAILK